MVFVGNKQASWHDNVIVCGQYSHVQYLIKLVNYFWEISIGKVKCYELVTLSHARMLEVTCKLISWFYMDQIFCHVINIVFSITQHLCNYNMCPSSYIYNHRNR